MDVYAGLLAQDGEKQDVDRYVHMWINMVKAGFLSHRQVIYQSGRQNIGLSKGSTLAPVTPNISFNF